MARQGSGFGSKSKGLRKTLDTVAWNRWREAEAFINKHGDTYEIENKKTGNSYFQQYPHVSISKSLHGILLKIEQEFGMTPSSSASVRIPFPKPEKMTEGEKWLEDFLDSRSS